VRLLERRIKNREGFEADNKGDRVQGIWHYFLGKGIKRRRGGILEL